MSDTQRLRLVTIPARSNTPNTLYLAFYAKHPEDTAPYSIDATAILFDQGRTIVGTPTVTANSSDITISAISQAAGITTFMASGGQDNASYGITYQATLDDATTITRVVWLQTLSLFPNTATPTIIAKGDPGGPPALAPAVTITTPAAGQPNSGTFTQQSDGSYVLSLALDSANFSDPDTIASIDGIISAFFDAQTPMDTVPGGGGDTGGGGGTSAPVTIDNTDSVVLTGSPGSAATLVFSPVTGQPNTFTFNASFPQGLTGASPAIDSTTINTGAAGSQASLVFSPVAGSPGHFTVTGSLPQGLQGIQGNPGAPLTVDSASIATGAPLSGITLVFTPVPGAPGHVTVTGSFPAGQTGATGGVSAFSPLFDGTWNPNTGLTDKGVTLTSSGGGGIANHNFVVSAAGTSSITGTSTAFGLGDFLTCNAAANGFFRQAALTLGSNFTTLGTGGTLLTPTLISSDDGVQDGKWRLVDGNGNIGLELGPSGLSVGALTSITASFASGAISGRWGVGTLAIGTNIAILDDGAADGVLSWRDNNDNEGMRLDESGLHVGALTVNGLPVTGSGTGTTTSGSFSAADIAALNTSALSAGAAQRATPNTTAQRATRNYNSLIGYGQSLSVGFQGAVAISLAQPYDSVMVGLSPRPYYMQGSGGTTFTPCGASGAGSNAFAPAVSANQAAGNTAPLTAPKTGALSNIQGVTVVAGSSNGTFTWTGTSNASTFCAIGDTFDVSGFTGSGLANNGNGIHVFTVAAVSASSIVTVEVPATVSTPQNGITFAQSNYANLYGEETSVGAVNQWRQYQLARRGLGLDPTRILVAASLGVINQSIAQLSKGAASPTYYNRLLTYLTALKAAAASAASGATTGCPVILYNQGTADQTAGTTFESYLAQLGTLHQNMLADIASGLAQASPPMLLLVQTNVNSGGDFDSAGVERMPIKMAQLAYAGLAPSIGYPAPATPDVYMVAPFYPLQNHGPHGTSNGYRLLANQAGYVAGIVQDGGSGWKPLYPLTAVFRGTEIEASFSVPSPPLVAAPAFSHGVFQASVFTDLGFCVTDDSAAIPGTSSVPIISVTIVADAVVQIVVSRALSTNPYLWYADNGQHQGIGNLRDSSAAQGINTWDYTLGSGQSQAESVPSLNGKNYPLANWCVSFAIPIVAG